MTDIQPTLTEPDNEQFCPHYVDTRYFTCGACATTKRYRINVTVVVDATDSEHAAEQVHDLFERPAEFDYDVQIEREVSELS